VIAVISQTVTVASIVVFHPPRAAFIIAFVESVCVSVALVPSPSTIIMTVIPIFPSISITPIVPPSSVIVVEFVAIVKTSPRVPLRVSSAVPVPPAVA
jgi:hypothetical protein